MNTTSKTLLTFLMLIGTKAYTKEGLISFEVLNENQIDPAIVNSLILDQILQNTCEIGYYKLNEQKVNLLSSNHSELSDFLNWLRSITGQETQINEKKSSDMTPSTQDFDARMK